MRICVRFAAIRRPKYKKKMTDQVPLSSTNTIFTIIVLIVPGDLFEGASRQALL